MARVTTRWETENSGPDVLNWTVADSRYTKHMNAASAVTVSLRVCPPVCVCVVSLNSWAGCKLQSSQTETHSLRARAINDKEHIMYVCALCAVCIDGVVHDGIHSSKTRFVLDCFIEMWMQANVNNIYMYSDLCVQSGAERRITRSTEAADKHIPYEPIYIYIHKNFYFFSGSACRMLVCSYASKYMCPETIKSEYKR